VTIAGAGYCLGGAVGIMNSMTSSSPPTTRSRMPGFQLCFGTLCERAEPVARAEHCVATMLPALIGYGRDRRSDMANCRRRISACRAARRRRDDDVMHVHDAERTTEA